MSTPITTAKPPPKAAKKSKLVTLRLSPDRLSAFPSAVPSSKSSTSSSSASIKKPDPTSSVVPPDPSLANKTSDTNSTPGPPAAGEGLDPDSLAPPPKVDGKRKRGGGTGTGRKRAPPVIDPDAPQRERGRPGPKKKPRLADGTIDHSQEGTAKKGPAPATGVIPAHKLGPKANTGAINAGLRALDRTGKPCRKWQRKGLQLKSFTGALWTMPSWKAPIRDPGFSGDVKSDTTGSSELKPNGSSAVPSERSNSGMYGGEPRLTNGLENSPAPPVAA